MKTKGLKLTGILLFVVQGTLPLPVTAQTEPRNTLTGHTNAVVSVVFSPDGKQIISGSWDGSVKVWDAENGKELRTLKGSMEAVFSVAFSPDGKRIVVGGGTDRDKPGEVRVWDAGSYTEILSLKGHTDRVISVSFSPDGKRIVSGSADRTIKVWDADTGKLRPSRSDPCDLSLFA